MLRPGGVLAVRDSDYAGFFWAPANPQLDRWLELYHQLTAANRADADAGRHLPGWVRAGGLTDLTVTSSNWTFADPAGRAWWAGVWADRGATRPTPPRPSPTACRTTPNWPASRPGGGRMSEPDGVFVVPSVEVTPPFGRMNESMTFP